MTCVRWCPTHRMPYESYCPICPGEDSIDWWVVDIELPEQSANWRIAVVEGFRVRWEQWYEDIFPPIAERMPNGMTAAAATRQAYGEMGKRQARSRRQEARRKAKRHKVEPPDWAALSR